VTKDETDKIARAWHREEVKAREIERRVRASWELAPIASEKPDIVQAPLAGLWPKRRALLIINSKSGPNRDSLSRVRDLVELLATFRIRVDVRVKLRKSQARNVARAAAKKKRYDLIIAAGGDGTVEAVASGLVGTRATLGILPLGTFNNVASSLGIPTDVRDACALIACGASRRIDVGLMVAQYMRRPRIFLEVSTVGVGAVLGQLGQHVEKGRWEEAAQAIPGVAGLSLTPTQVRLDDSVNYTANTLLVTVSNTPRAGGGLQLAPDAYMDDGLLDVAVYSDLSAAGLLAHFVPGVPDGTPGQIWKSRARTVEVQTARPMPVSIESKLVGVTPARFTTLPRAVSVIVGQTGALLEPAAPALVQTSRYVASSLGSPGTATPNDMHGGLGARALQKVIPVVGHTVDAVGAVRPVALPLATGVAGVAAAFILQRIRLPVAGFGRAPAKSPRRR